MASTETARAIPKIQRTSPGGSASMTIRDGNILATPDAG
jgi:hypothetical protein